MRTVLTRAEPLSPEPLPPNGHHARHRRPRHRRLRRRWIAVAIVLVVVAGFGGGSGLAYYAVKRESSQLQGELTRHLQLGQAALESGKDNLKQANATHDVKFVNAASAEFKEAKLQFSTTRQIADGSKFLKQVEGLPGPGAQARPLHIALDHVADMGMALSDAGIELSTLAGQIIVPQKSGQAGKTLLNVLDAVDKSIGTVRADLSRAAASAAAIDVSVVPAGQQATLAKARGSIANGLAALDEFEQFVPMMREVFGANGPRNYLIEQVNPAELRPGGGFMGTYSVLRVDQGSMKLIKSGDAYALVYPRPVVGEAGYVVPPGPLYDLIGDRSWSFIDSNFFPDFVSNAVAAEQFAAPRLGMKIDAVVAIDFYTIAKLLEVTGPLRVPGYGVTVTSQNFVPLVVQGGIQGDIQGNQTNKAILAATAGPLMERVVSLPSQQWPSLISILNGLASARHLQAFFNNSTVQSSISAFGWSGQLNPHRTSDFMMETEANLGSTKANYFLTRRYDVVLTRQGSLLHHVVTVTVTDNMPYVYRPNEFYRAYFRLLFPVNASSARDDLTQLRWPNPSPPAGLHQLAGWIQIHGYGHSAQVTFSYDTPWQADRLGRDEIYWQKQPGTLDDAVHVTWNDNGRRFSASGSLHQDLTVELTTNGVALLPAAIATAAIPSLSLG